MEIEEAVSFVRVVLANSSVDADIRQIVTASSFIKRAESTALSLFLDLGDCFEECKAECVSSGDSIYPLQSIVTDDDQLCALSCSRCELSGRRNFCYLL